MDKDEIYMTDTPDFASLHLDDSGHMVDRSSRHLAEGYLWDVFVCKYTTAYP